MLPGHPEDVPHILPFAIIQTPPDESVQSFLDACESNNIDVAIQLASDLDAAALTVGLNKSIRADHLTLASQLLGVGAEWDSHTVRHASLSLKAVKWLVESGYNVNTGLVGGHVLLNLVVQRNDEDCIQYLLDHGANPNLGPPLHGTVSLIPPVSNLGSNINLAAGLCTPGVVALLISYGADISHSISLHFAAGHVSSSHDVTDSSRISMLEYLVGLGLDINAMDSAIKVRSDSRGQHGTPLQYAVRWGRVVEFQWLLEHGADPDKKTPWGSSARDDLNANLDRHGPEICRPFLDLLENYDNSMLSQAGV